MVWASRSGGRVLVLCAGVWLAAIAGASRVEAAPVAEDLTATTTAGALVTIALHGTNPLDAALAFAIEGNPAHGTLGAIGAPDCTYPGGMTDCTADVVYTPANGFAGSDSFTYRVSDLSSAYDVATVTVTVTGAPVMPAPAMHAVGDPYGAVVSEVVPGATVDYGDGTAEMLLTVGGDGSALLDHVYVLEGSFIITVTNPTGVARTCFVHVIFAGADATSTETVAPGGSGTIALPGLTATLTRPLEGSSPVTLVGAVYPPTVPGFFVSTFFGEPLAAFDLRVVGPADRDSVTIVFGYPDAGVPALPTLTFLDPATNAFEPVSGSVRVPDSLVIDVLARLVTVVLDETSSPAVPRLTGTRLVVSDLAAPRVTEVGAPWTTRMGSVVQVHTGQSASCPAGGRRCTVSLRAQVDFDDSLSALRAPNLVMGHRKIRLRAGQSAELAFKLAGKARRLLARLGRLRLMVAFDARVSGQSPRSIVRTLTVEDPGPAALCAEDAA